LFYESLVYDKLLLYEKAGQKRTSFDQKPGKGIKVNFTEDKTD
jgi:hypothetical protein